MTGEKANKVLVRNRFTQTHFTVLNKKTAYVNVHNKENQSRKGLYLRNAFEFQDIGNLSIFFNFTPDNCVLCEPAFVDIVRFPVLIFRLDLHTNVNILY